MKKGPGVQDRTHMYCSMQADTLTKQRNGGQKPWIAWWRHLAGRPAAEGWGHRRSCQLPCRDASVAYIVRKQLVVLRLGAANDTVP